MGQKFSLYSKKVELAFNKWISLRPEKDGPCCSKQAGHYSDCERENAWKKYVALRDFESKTPISPERILQ